MVTTKVIGETTYRVESGNVIFSNNEFGKPVARSTISLTMNVAGDQGDTEISTKIHIEGETLGAFDKEKIESITSHFVECIMLGSL